MREAREGATVVARGGIRRFVYFGFLNLSVFVEIIDEMFEIFKKQVSVSNPQLIRFHV